MAYIDSTTNQGQSATPSVAVPTGMAAGYEVILACAIDALDAAFDVGDWPTGFTELGEVDLTGDGHSFALGWKRLTGADSGSYTFGSLTAGSPGWVCQAIAFSGRHDTDPPTISTIATNNSANASPVTITANGVTALDGDDLLWIGAPDVRAAGIGNGMTAPSGYTEKEDQESTTDGGWANLSMAIKENVSAGATGSVSGSFALTSGSSGWAAALVRIPAAAAGGGGGGAFPHHYYYMQGRGRQRFTRKGPVYVPATFARAA